MTRFVLAAIAALAVGVAVAVASGACSGSPGGPAVNSKPNPEPAPGSAVAPGGSSVVSADILAREPVANTATVKHILISWRDLADAFGGHLDARAEKRSKADAEAEVRSLVKQLQDGADFDALMKAHSEDVSSAMSGRAFTVTPDAQLVIEFRQLSLRLKPGEFGVCQSDFGFHIIKRVT
jgi:parvulin-like peptidyl-prolyl cis-trans isomerase-like protein